jgi:hypothetical protein
MPAKNPRPEMANMEYLALGFRMKAMNLEMRPLDSDMMIFLSQLN